MTKGLSDLVTEGQILTTLGGTKAASGDNELVAAPGENQRIVVTAFVIQNTTATATTLILRSGTTSNAWRVLAQNQGDGLALFLGPLAAWRLNNNEALNLNLSGANTAGYTVQYYVERII
jgi:hypothetical protein